MRRAERRRRVVNGVGLHSAWCDGSWCKLSNRHKSQEDTLRSPVGWWIARRSQLVVFPSDIHFPQRNIFFSLN